MVYIVQFMCKQIITRYGNRGAQGFNAAPSLDVMLLKPQVFSASGPGRTRTAKGLSSMLTASIIPFCSFFLRNWRSGWPITCHKS